MQVEEGVVGEEGEGFGGFCVGKGHFSDRNEPLGAAVYGVRSRVERAGRSTCHF